MDKRINFLYDLKKRLNAYIISDNVKKDSFFQKNQTSFMDHTILQAKMLCENVKSGIALGEISFDSSKAYAEFSKNGKLNFHIYPKNTAEKNPFKEKLDEYKEMEEQKIIYSRVE